MASLEKRTLYEVLGVPPDASYKDIVRAYRQKAAQYHPDKSSETSVQFQECTDAYQTLKDSLLRQCYDLDNNIVECTEIEILKIGELRKSNAARAVALMDEAVIQSIYEEEPDGLIILTARYGMLQLPPRMDHLARYQESMIIDVRVPLQCLVDCSQLILPAGPKYLLEGFYDPVETYAGVGTSTAIFGSDRETLIQKHMVVQYSFHGKLHQVVVEDRDRLEMPLRAHVCAEEDSAFVSALRRVQNKSNDRKAEQARRQKTRRRVFGVFVGLAVCAIGAFALRNSDLFLWAARIAVVDTVSTTRANSLVEHSAAAPAPSRRRHRGSDVSSAVN